MIRKENTNSRKTTEKENRARSLRILVFAFIFACSFFLRMSSYRFGLPYQYHPGEQMYLDSITHYIESPANSHPKQDISPLFTRMVTTWALVSSQFRTPAELIDSGRQISILLGSLTAVVIGWTVYSLSGLFPGFIAGLLLSLSPLHFEHSQYATADILLTFLMSCCLWFCLSGHLYLQVRRIWIAGLIAGIAFLTKPQGCLMGIIPIVACLFYPAGSIRKKTLFTLITAAIEISVVLMLYPGNLLSLNPFQDISSSLFSLQFHNMICIANLSSVEIYPIFALSTVGITGSILVVVTCTYACIRPASIIILNSVIVSLLIFAAVLFFNPPLLPENLVTALPSCIILSALGFHFLRNWINKFLVNPIFSRTVILFLTGMIVIPPYLLSAELHHILIKPDTRDTASLWLLKADPGKTLTVLTPQSPTHYFPPGFLPDNGIPVMPLL